MTNKDYSELTKKASPNSKSFRNIPMAFVVGGLICALGQLLIWIFTTYGGLELKVASTCASIALVFLSATFTGLGIFDKIAKHAGAGTLVPITGFANAIAAPALEFKSEGMILGVGAKMFVIAGPVIVYGIAASVLYGLILFLFRLV